MPNVTSIGMRAFQDTTSLTSVDMPNVEIIEQYAFSGASALSYVGLGDKLKVDANGYILDDNNNRILLPYKQNYMCRDYGGIWSGGSCFLGIVNAFSGTNISTCGQQGGSCGTCTGSGKYLVSGRGCVTADTCGISSHYQWDSSTNSCNRVQTAQNNQQGTGNGTGTGTGTASGTDSGTTTAASCTNGASIGGECFPKRYTPAEIAELVGESNTILLYYK